MWLLKNSQPRKSQKIKLRQETVQSIFSGRLDIFYPPSSASLRPKGSFSTPTGDFTQNRVVGEMTIFPNYAQLPPYRPSGADDSEVILHPPSATEPDCIRPSVYQIASGSNEILCCVGQGLPSIEPARKIGNVAKPGAPQDTGRDRAAVAALAMDDEQFAAIQLRDSIRQLSQGNPDGILHSAALFFPGPGDIKSRNVVLLFSQQARKSLPRDLRNVIQLIPAPNPTANAVFEVRLYVFNANARQPHLRFPQMVSVFSDEDDALVETKNPGRPGRVLPGEANMD